ncbi:hypothetical protein E2C01_065638 [Portunus trituberculatus]|uniref:Uncharacterized protein n=1 Tax=Portunus trituberculatus TaxID=210409 RepID=A0A5B7HF36_PORTR|nr:hypothetical protein [Portunus trituberculatus]
MLGKVKGERLLPPCAVSPCCRPVPVPAVTPHQGSNGYDEVRHCDTLTSKGFYHFKLSER